MFHCFILEPDMFNDTYAVAPDGIDRRTKEGKADWEAWQIANEGKLSVSKPTLAELQAMRDSIMNHKVASRALMGGMAESCMFWTHTIGTAPIECKSRPDYITSNGFIVDIKTTTDARPDEFSRSCYNFRYHVQAAFYCDGYEALFGRKPEGFLFIAIEKEPPYALELYIANEAMVEQGRREYMNDLLVYDECIKQDVWPAYSEEIKSICLPRWAQEL
jgi:exodeoxyribonuclease VIII